MIAQDCETPIRPISNLVGCIDQAKQALGRETAHVIVVGGGAAGVELPMSIMGRWKPVLVKGCLKVTLLDAGSRLLPNRSPACQQALNGIMKEKGIKKSHKKSSISKVERKCHMHIVYGPQDPLSICLPTCSANGVLLLMIVAGFMSMTIYRVYHTLKFLPLAAAPASRRQVPDYRCQRWVYSMRYAQGLFWLKILLTLFCMSKWWTMHHKMISSSWSYLRG